MAEPADRHWTFLAEQITQLEISERSNGRWLTTAAAGLLVASVIGIAVAAVYATRDGEAAASWLAWASAAAALAAFVLAAYGFLSGGRPGSAARVGQLEPETLDDYVRKATRLLADQERRNDHRARFMRFSGAALIAALMLGAASVATEQIDGSNAEGSTGGTGGGEDGTRRSRLTDAELAAQFRPVVLFDSKERWRPLEIERFLAEGSHRACRLRTVPCPAIRGADALDEPTAAGTLLHVNGRADLQADAFTSPDPACRDRARRRLDCDAGPATRIYYRVTRDRGRAYVDYWWYLRFNDAPLGKFDHQSDWEGVVVAVDERRDEPTFDWVGFAAHEGVWRYFRESLRCGGDRRAGSCGSGESRHGDRVNVYVAAGTHAAYPVPCAPGRLVRLCEQSTRVPLRLLERFRVPESGFDGKAAWGANDDPEALAAFPDRGWVSWPGRWDPKGSVKSPADQTRFRAPATATIPGDCPRQLCSAAPPPGFRAACFGWFGPNAAATACHPPSLRGATPLGATPFSLRRGSMDGDAFVPAAGEPPGVGSPGVAQLLGTYLEIGEAVQLAGPAPAGTELYARIRRGDALVEVRFAGITLAAGETAVLRATEGLRRGATARLAGPDGTERQPSGEVVLAAGQE